LIGISVKSLTAAIVVLLAVCAKAEVTDAAGNGFTIRHSVSVAVTRAALYDIAISDIDHWWHDDHTISGNARNLYIEARPLGCFCERLADNAGLVHLTVTFVNPGVMLRLSGGLGPLGLMGVSGNMTWEFADSDAGSTITLQYAVGGYLDGGLDTLAVAVDSVLVEQMARLKARAEGQL
jgi:hypothetical protein